VSKGLETMGTSNWLDLAPFPAKSPSGGTGLRHICSANPLPHPRTSTEKGNNYAGGCATGRVEANPDF